MAGTTTNAAIDGYYNRPSDDLWWAIFTRDNPNVDYQQNQVRVSQMLVNDDGDKKRNTKGKLVAIPGMGREGEDWLTWNRPFMEELFKNKEVWILPNGQKTVDEVVADFNKIWKFQLSPRDYYDRNIEIIDLPMTLEVQMRPTCLCYQGTLTIHIGTPKVHIGEVIINRDLSGLQYPTDQNVKGQAPFYVFERDFTFAGEELKEAFGYDDIISSDQLEILNYLWEDVWVAEDGTVDYNMKEARVVYNGDTANCPSPCNQSFSNVLLIEVSDVLCKNYAGHLILHYNILEAPK